MTGALGLSALSRLTVIMTMSAAMMATMSIAPKINCHLRLSPALLFAAVPLTALGVVPGARRLFWTLRVLHLGQRRRIAEYFSPQRRQVT